jgi:hypothetical protein
LGHELDQLAEVLESAQLIAELLVDDAMPDAETAARAPRMLEAVLALAVGRVWLLRKVVVGAADAGLIVSRQNRALPRLKRDDPDVVLPLRKKR